MRQSDIIQVLCHASESGLDGFGGACFRVAVAINAALFDGRGTVVVACNNAFKKSAGRLIGHAAVLYDGVYWDADGRPKEWGDIESWGMLDQDDPDYQEEAAEVGIDWNEAAAFTVERLEYTHCDASSVFGADTAAIDALSDAKTAVVGLQEEVTGPSQ